MRGGNIESDMFVCGCQCAGELCVVALWGFRELWENVSKSQPINHCNPSKRFTVMNRKLEKWNREMNWKK